MHTYHYYNIEQHTYHYYNKKHVTYHYYSTKHVLVSLLQYKTCKPTTITIQNMCKYQYYSTKNTPTTITIQNIYAYHYYNTKLVNVPLLQYKNVLLPLLLYRTCKPTTITI
jgi:hypothetical protein